MPYMTLYLDTEEHAFVKAQERGFVRSLVRRALQDAPMREKVLEVQRLQKEQQERLAPKPPTPSPAPPAPEKTPPAENRPKVVGPEEYRRAQQKEGK